MKNPLRLVDRRGLLILLGAAVLITLVSVIAIVLVMSTRERDANRAEAERLSREQRVLRGRIRFGMEDFYLDTRDSEAGITYPMREVQRYWTEDEAGFYWIDPSDAGLDRLVEDNDARIRESLGLSPSEETP